MTLRPLLRVMLIAGFWFACAHDPEERRVWTTRPNLDACEEFREPAAPPHSLFRSRAECQNWVASRNCRPGSCFDGCNSVSCDGAGKEAQKTLLYCYVEVEETIEFRPGSPEPVSLPPPKFSSIKAELADALEARGRKVLLIGHAENAEADTDAEREQLRQRRAEVVRGLLIAAGLPGERLFAKTRSEIGRWSELPAHQHFVSFELDPEQPTRTDSVARGNRVTEPWCD